MEYKCSKSQIFKHTLSKLLIANLVILLFSCSTYLNAQSYSSSDKKAIKLYTEAQAFYQSYDLSKTELKLKESLERDPKFIEARTLLAYIYLDQNKYAKAKESFKQAIQSDPGRIPNNLYFLGELELQDGNYEAAKKYLNNYLKTNKTTLELADRSMKALDNIEFAMQAKANPRPFKPVNLGPSINSEQAEYFPSVTVDENTLLFTRRLPSKQSPQGFNEDFYVAKKVNGEWQQAVNMEKPINTSKNEGAPSLSADGQLLIFTACELYGDYGGNRKGFGSCDLFYSSKKGNNWSQPINLGKTINTNHWETQPSFSADGKTLYFVRGKRDRKGNRKGDIYVSTLTPDSYWTQPVPLSKTLNTPENEESVFIHPDGKTLYFSSNGHIGMGGLDIFMSKKQEDGEWSKPINLGYPINSHKNENSLLVSANGEIAFFASDREDGYGELDLYSFDLPKEFAPNKVTYFAGKIYDVKTNKPLGARFELIDLESEELIVESFSDPTTGEFLLTLPAGKNYALNASRKGYLFYSDNFALKDGNSNTPFRQDVPLQPIEVGEKIVLKNIFFETAKYSLKNESKAELNKLVDFLKNNAQIKIEIAGHTDNVGAESYNLELSNNRAKEVKEYLVKAGITADRLSWKGYGASKPIADNSTVAGKAKNRRTEFQIVGL